MKFGEKVRDLRKKHSLTQDELAQCLGINKRTIIGWERDGRYPRSIEMLDSDEVYQMTKRGLDAAQIAATKGIHLNLVLVKLLELHHLGYDLRHYHAQHHAFIKQLNLPEYYRFDAAG